MSANENPVEISVAVPEISRNKRGHKKNINYFFISVLLSLMHYVIIILYRNDNVTYLNHS